jgi:Ion channel
MWPQLLAALLLAASNVLIHSLGSYSIFRWIVHVLRKHPVPTLLQAWSMMVRLVVALLVLHAMEVAVWAQFYLSRHCFSDAETAYYYSLTSYTTLGYGDVLLSRPWRIMGGLEAMVGVLMFGWSTAALVSLLNHLQQVRIKKQLSGAAG